MGQHSDEWRQARLQELAERHGSNAALGRALGYKDGAYVRQMIAGERAISEKTIAKAERLPGCAGWFSKTTPAVSTGTPPAPSPRFEDKRTLDPEDWRLWQAFKMAATPEERKLIVARYELAERLAEEKMRDLQEQIKKGERP
jgi:hypothetical protein